MFDALERLKELREAKGWSVYKLAKLSGIPQSSIATWYGKSLCPPVDKLEILCNTLGISLSEFFSTTSQIEATELNKRFLDQWITLSNRQKESILELIDAFKENT